MKPIFCGNFDFEARSSDLERLFRRYGKVDRVDMKSGYAFIYMDDDRDAEDAVRALDRSEFGRKGRRLRVEWSKAAEQQERGARKSLSSRRSANLRPSKTLFVINFPYHTKTMDLERHFDPYGKIVNVRIRKNFAFVQYESQEDATKALDATNMSKLQDRVISVEYAARDDDERRGGGYSPDRRVRDRSPDRRRSPSPYRRERGSPDYGTGSGPAAYRRERGSPDYGIRPSLSPRRAERSPEYRAHSSRSPRRVERSSEYGNGPNRSPRQTSRHSLHYGRELSSSPRHVERRSPDVHDRDRNRNRSPLDGERNGNGKGNGGYGRGPNRSRSRSRSPTEEGAISDDDQEPRSPVDKPDMRDMSPIKKPGLRGSSPVGEYGSPTDARYRSPSPPARERSQS